MGEGGVRLRRETTHFEWQTLIYILEQAFYKWGKLIKLTSLKKGKLKQFEMWVITATGSTGSRVGQSWLRSVLILTLDGI